MSSIPGEEPRQVRSLFVSDIHLGCKHSRAEEFLEFLKRYQPQYLYVIGDFIDGWRLKRRWRWLPEYDDILKHLLALRSAGTELFYTPGNHDSFLREFLSHLGSEKLVKVRDQFVHIAADERRFLVTHGDKFDWVEINAPWLSVLATHVYSMMLTIDCWLQHLRGGPRDRYAFCGAIKQRVKMLVKHVSEFERKLVESARCQRCHGIICGHIHVPRIGQLDDLAYLNSGDWVENCTALIEYQNGDFELVRRDGSVVAQLAGRPLPRRVRRRRVAAVAAAIDGTPAEQEMLVA
jgi:UDP-2,3-diacylglucosamine pyrophosphatase LpxH